MDHEPLPTVRDGYNYQARCACGWESDWLDLPSAGAQLVRHMALN